MHQSRSGVEIGAAGSAIDTTCMALAMCIIRFATNKKKLLRGLGVLFLDKYCIIAIRYNIVEH